MIRSSIVINYLAKGFLKVTLDMALAFFCFGFIFGGMEPSQD